MKIGTDLSSGRDHSVYYFLESGVAIFPDIVVRKQRYCCVYRGIWYILGAVS